MTRLKQYITEGIEDKGIFKAVFMAGHPGCFDENTFIKTQNGYKLIKNISIGDNIFTFNEDTYNEELKPVENVMEYKSYNNDIIELEFEDGTKVICTEDHKFFVEGKWIMAKDL